MTLNEILASPKILWAILTTEHKVLGPWAAHRGTGWSFGSDSLARFHYDGDQRIYIRKASKLDKPEEYEFHEWGGVDWEGLEKAIKEWEAEKLLWKEWEYVSQFHREYETYYADSKEEAMKLADELARGKGYMLYDGE